MPRYPTNQSPERRTYSSHYTWRSRLAGLAVLLGLTAAVIYLPVFRVQEVRVTPTRAMTADDVRSKVPIKLQQHLLKGLGPDLIRVLSLRNGAAETILIKAFPFIRAVEVRIDFPGAIEIAVEERVEVAYIGIPDGCVMLDKEGYALRILSVRPTDIPVIGGVQVTSLILGQKLTVDSREAMNGAVSTLSAIIDADKDTRTPQKLLTQIRSIRPLSDGRLFLALALPATGDELTIAAENSADLLDDMLWLRFAMDQGALDNRGKGVLDLTGTRKVFIPDA